MILANRWAVVIGLLISFLINPTLVKAASDEDKREAAIAKLFQSTTAETDITKLEKLIRTAYKAFEPRFDSFMRSLIQANQGADARVLLLHVILNDINGTNSIFRLENRQIVVLYGEISALLEPNGIPDSVYINFLMGEGIACLISKEPGLLRYVFREGRFSQPYSTYLSSVRNMASKNPHMCMHYLGQLGLDDLPFLRRILNPER